MAKFPTFPTILDNTQKIAISDLKRYGYLKSSIPKMGSLKWSCRGEETASIVIFVNMNLDIPYLEVDYQFRQEHRKYKIELVSIPSNLGRGEVWYFLCPATKKRCRVLYCVDGDFLHRKAFTNCMYERQTESKKTRKGMKALRDIFNKDKLTSQIFSPYFKTHYKDKPTKRYLKILEKLEKVNLISLEEMERLLIL